jgi:phospholipid/cholesterol/gamma-HCH transport system ATP-binding protein
MQAIIELKGIHTQFDKAVIHHQLDLTIQQGEVLAIIGGSGTGKTTLLREMLLLEHPTTGSIDIFGENILQMNEAKRLQLRRRCGVMFQNGALFGALTVADNIILPLREHTQLSDYRLRQLAHLKIALVGLDIDAADKYPDQLSGGMIKRVAVARALALDPDILFLDEPSAGLDPIGAGNLDQLILELQKRLGLTVVMVTHDLDSLWTITNRVAVLAEKKVIAVDSMTNLAKHPHAWINTYLHGPRGIRFVAKD